WGLVAAAGLCVSAAGAWGQMDAAPPPMGEEGAALGGPDVEPREVPGVRGRFGEGVEGERGRWADRIPPHAMREALGAIMREDAPEDVRARPEQREAIRAHMRAFEEQMRGFVREHRDEFRSLREEGGGRRGPGAFRGRGEAPRDEGEAPGREQVRERA